MGLAREQRTSSPVEPDPQVGVVAPAMAKLEGLLVMLGAQSVPGATAVVEAVDGLQTVAEVPNARLPLLGDRGDHAVLVVLGVLVLINEDDRVAPSQTLGDRGRGLEQAAGQRADVLEARVAAMSGVGHDGLLESQVRGI